MSRLNRQPSCGLAALLLYGSPREGLSPADVKLCIGNLSISTSEGELKPLFMRVGVVTDLTIMRDGTSGKSRGYGYIAMSAQSEAGQAISSFNAQIFNDQILEVSLASPRVQGGAAHPPFEP